MRPDPLIERPTAARRQRNGSRGFTLIEISVALVAGLVVGLAVVGLSKEATNTFHEEMRSSAAEMGLRTAVERLRSDLARAAYMSTPNIAGDPNLAIGYTPPAAFPQIGRLTGVRSYWGGSSLASNLTGVVAPVLQGTDDFLAGISAAQGAAGILPDAIDISGNLTSPDSFFAGVGTGAGTCTGGVQLNLEVTSPATLAILATLPAATGPAAALKAVFLPAGMTTGVARIVDDKNRSQYVVVCAVAATATSATVDVGPVLGIAGFATGRLTINPVTTVRWRIAPTEATYAALNNPADPARFDLYRGYVDAAGADVVGSQELIAEYAIDLKFGWTYDSGNSGGPALGGGTLPNPIATTLKFDDSAASTFTTWQKIRSVNVCHAYDSYRIRFGDLCVCMCVYVCVCVSQCMCV